MDSNSHMESLLAHIPNGGLTQFAWESRLAKQLMHLLKLPRPPANFFPAHQIPCSSNIRSVATKTTACSAWPKMSACRSRARGAFDTKP